jgi:ubiquinone/menaquinone biosynthesis C-methylase UbiE
MPHLTRSAAAFRRRLGRRASLNPGTYDPARYWDSRAKELIEIYDHPEDWASLKWMRSGVEEELVPRLLVQRGSRSAFVIGAGSGRQYQYLLPVVDTLTGIDISPRLVAECRRRYPTVETEVCSIIDADERHRSVDAVVSSAVLQHVPADQIAAAVSSVKALARDLVVVRELTLAAPAAYQWAHSYREMFHDWSLIHEMVTDERPGVRVELLAFVRTTE